MTLLGGFAAEVAGEQFPDSAWRLRKAREHVKRSSSRLADELRLHEERQAMDALFSRIATQPRRRTVSTRPSTRRGARSAQRRSALPRRPAPAGGGGGRRASSSGPRRSRDRGNCARRALAPSPCTAASSCPRIAATNSASPDREPLRPTSTRSLSSYLCQTSWRRPGHARDLRLRPQPSSSAGPRDRGAGLRCSSAGTRLISWPALSSLMGQSTSLRFELGRHGQQG